MFMESISHAKDHYRADLPIFITRLIWSLNTRIVLLGELYYAKEKPMSVTVSGVKRMWTLDLVVMMRVEDSIRCYPLWAGPFHHIRVMPFTSPDKV